MSLPRHGLITHQKQHFNYFFRSTQEFVNCKIVAAPGQYNFKPYAIGYQKNSPYAEMLDYHIEKMREAGVLDNIKNKYRALPQQCPNFRQVFHRPAKENLLSKYFFSF